MSNVQNPEFESKHPRDSDGKFTNVMGKETNAMDVNSSKLNVNNKKSSKEKSTKESVRYVEKSEEEKLDIVSKTKISINGNEFDVLLKYMHLLQNDFKKDN